jgi:hypothetical protein
MEVICETVTGDDGSYKFWGLSDGAYRLKASLPKDMKVVNGQSTSAGLKSGMGTNDDAEMSTEVWVLFEGETELIFREDHDMSGKGVDIELCQDN